jgi:hypothetical protein
MDSSAAASGSRCFSRSERVAVTFNAYGVDPDEAYADSTLEMPLLPAQNFTVGGHPNIVRRFHEIVAKRRAG